MAAVTILHPDHPAVAAALQLFDQHRTRFAAHIAWCGTCTRHPPLRYRTCTTGRDLGAAMVAARTALINADAAAARSGDVAQDDAAYLCPDCGRASCTGEGCYWPDEAGIRRPDDAAASATPKGD